jgi:hypothetical protein
VNVPGFSAGSATPISRTINTERTENLIVEKDPNTPKSEASLIIRPALTPWTVCSPGPIRALYVQDDRFFAVSGTSTSFYYEIEQSRQVITRGQMIGDTRPASICSNGTGGNQNMIVSGGLGYIHDLATNSFTQITDGEFLTPSEMAMYFEGYFLSLQRGTNTFQLSAILDGLSWNGLDTGQCSITSDQKFAMALLSRTIFFAGNKNIEPWYNSGNASFPIQPESGVTVKHGISARYSFANLDNTLYWLGQDANGSAIVWRFNGYTPERVSTHPIENIIRQWPTQDDAIGFCFQVNGHAFYCLYSVHNDTTLVYDISVNQWVEFSRWDLVWMRDFPWPVRCACSWNGNIYLGGSNLGVIYKLEFGVYGDEVAV